MNRNCWICTTMFLLAALATPSHAQCPGPCAGDLDGDGRVSTPDLAILLSFYGTSCEQAWHPDEHTIGLWRFNGNGLDCSDAETNLEVMNDRVGWINDAPHCRAALIGGDPLEGDCSDSDCGGLKTSGGVGAYKINHDLLIEAVIYYPSSSASYTIVTHCCGGQNMHSTYALRIEAGTAALYINDVAVVSADVSSLRAEWFTLSAQYSYRESASIFADDALLATATVSVTPEIPDDSDNYRLYVGGDPCHISTGLKLDELHISKIERPKYRLTAANYGTHAFSRFEWPTRECAGDACSCIDPHLPSGVVRAPDNWICATSENNRILRINPVTCECQTFFNGTPLNQPICLAFGPDDDLYVANYSYGQISRYEYPGGMLVDSAFLTDDPNNPDDIAQSPIDMIFGPDGDLYITCTYEGTDKVLRYNGVTGEYLGDFVASGSGGIDHPNGLRFGPDGNLYVISGSTNQVMRYDGETGAFLDPFINHDHLSAPRYMEFGPDGALYITNMYADNITIYDGLTGEYLSVLSGCGLSRPTGLAFTPLE